jgi:hypothetical protein
MGASCRGLAIVFGLLGAAVPAEVVDRIAATVNDSAIPESELRRAMVVSALERLTGESAEAYRGRVLDALIEERLEYDDAQRFGLAPPDAAEIGKAMDGLRERLRAAGKDPDAEFAAAGMSVDEVRASIERQLVIAAYVRERFAPVSYADEEQAREEYEKRYVPEEKAAGRAPAPYDQVAAEMRRRYSVRAFDEQVARWLKDLRGKARISIFRMPVAVPTDRMPVVLMAAPTPAVTPPR